MCVCLQVLNSIFHIPGDEVVSAAVVEHQEHHQAMSSKWHRPADTYTHDGASVLYVRATRTSLLRAVRTRGARQLAL